MDRKLHIQENQRTPGKVDSKDLPYIFRLQTAENQKHRQNLRRILTGQRKLPFEGTKIRMFPFEGTKNTLGFLSEITQTTKILSEVFKVLGKKQVLELCIPLKVSVKMKTKQTFRQTRKLCPQQICLEDMLKEILQREGE